jgi:hypothetical protein
MVCSQFEELGRETAADEARDAEDSGAEEG